MRIYKAEKEAGLAPLLKSNSSISYITKVESLPAPQKLTRQDKILGALATKQGKQRDLYYFKSLLASVGWNLNYDVFAPEEAYAARYTPENKPLNFEHKQTDIIGHMTASCLVNDKLEVISDVNDKGEELTEEEIPSQFHIFTNAVIYKEWEDKDQQERVNQAIAKIEDGDIYVSMECTFTDFDYAIEKPDGSQYIIERNKSTAHLTKHLRPYGGKGEYQGCKIGRLFRNLTFSGKGLVEEPANPASLTFPDTTSFAGKAEANLENIFIKAEKLGYSKEESNNGDKIMADTLETLQKQLADIKAENDQLKSVHAKVATEKVTALEADKKQLADKITEMETSAKASAQDLADTKAKLVETEKQLEDKVKSLAKLEKDKLNAARAKVLVEKVGYSQEDADEAVSDMEMSDEKFTKFAEKAAKRWQDVKDKLAKADKADGDADDDAADAADKNAKADVLDKAKPNKENKLGVTDTVDETEIETALASLLSNASQKGE